VEAVMKIGKRENKQVKKRLESIFEGILEDAETQFMESLNDELCGYLEDEDDFMDVYESYFWDAVVAVYKRKGKE
jgi:hypothetical protein